ncbi:sulfurtransferase [Deinococcus seoulensis]|uniref:Sulfurtransferase n=2 Tax=Deinococcus TaxID=1298 RepID=A0ABQ2RYF4_9DEIO|nr:MULTISPECIES: rhodanese-like domain-containing protein [Deinococcus]GGR69260.1 sulfurtransferase [Deinococcus seoulensis]GGS37397.1 sulfurtransferase [Deinococcus knuensis]
MFKFIRKLLSGAAGPESVSPAEAQALIRQGAVLLDVRSAGERRAAHIPGSLHIPLDQLPGRLSNLPAGKTVVCQCASGNRSAQAARLLADAGIDSRNLRGGIGAWRAAGLPVRT